MKKLFITIILLAFSVMAFATIQESSVTTKVIDSIKSARNSAESTYTTLLTVKSRLKSLKETYSDKVVSGDKDLLNNLSTDLTNTIEQLNILISNIDTNFPTIKE